MNQHRYDFQIIVNLLSGKGEAGKKLVSLQKFLADRGLNYRTLTVDKPTPISQIPQDGRILIQEGVVCLGGDGTVSETVGYVLHNRINKPILVVPTGTANIIAGSLGVGERRQWELLLRGRLKTVDVGVATYSRAKEHFLLGIGLGFEEHFLRLAKEKLKRRLGVFSYLLAALGRLKTLEKIPLEIQTSDAVIRATVCLLVVFNQQPRLLKVFPLFRDQKIKADDSQLDLYYVEYRHYVQALLGTLAFHLLGKVSFGAVKSISGSAFTVSSPLPCPTQTDGELRGQLPVKLSVIPRGVSFFV